MYSKRNDDEDEKKLNGIRGTERNSPVINSQQL